MPFKPNYNFQRQERDRQKAARKEEKAREREERKRANIAAGIDPTMPDPVPAPHADEAEQGTDQG